MTDYSQDGEQHHILSACTEAHGRFLELGAWNPTDKSNTRALVERGWEGVMVEPSPVPFSNIEAEYKGNPHIILENAAVALEPGTLDMWITADGVSTSDETIWKKWRNTAKYDPDKVTVKAVTLEDLCRAYGPFDFVSIDTEGTSVALFRKLIDLGQRPKCIVVEYDDKLGEARDIAKAAGYAEVLMNGTNIVVVKQ
jgi:FkbM family methyltransferase